MSNDNYMTRGQSQVLYNYLPGKTFDYSGPYGIHKVTKVDTVKNSDVDTQFVIERVLSRVRQWNSTDGTLGATGFTQNPEQYQLVDPTKVRSELFPLLFYCSQCSIIDTYDGLEQLDRYNSTLTCRHCDGDLRQYRYVFIHDCGNIETPDPGKCSGCGSYNQWVLNTQDSQRFENFRWQCTDCGNQDELNGWCDCSLKDSRMRLAVHSGSSVHIPHHFSLINIEERTSGSPDSPVYAKKVLARYLKLTDTPIDDIDLELAGGGKEIQNLQTTLEELEKMYEQSGGKSLKDSIEETKSKIDKLQTSTSPLADIVEDHVSITEVSEETETTLEDYHATIVYQLRQYLSTIEDFDRRSVRQVITEAGLDDPQSVQSRKARAQRVERRLDGSGISRATFIEDFPMTNVVFGYSRGSRDEDEAILRGFGENAINSSGEGFPIFVDTVSTEATQFELNPRAVMGWLLENSRSNESPGRLLRNKLFDTSPPADHGYPVRSTWDTATIESWLERASISTDDVESLEKWDESEIRAWIVDNMTEIPEYSTITIEDTPENAVTYFVYHLVHTFSHILLKEITKLSGISRTSLSEHLLPYALSFIIYTDQREDFSLGGIYTMLESDLDDLLSEIHSKGNNCVYDPVCSRRGSACFSCMHVSEVSCSHLNRNIGRDFLFGSKLTADRSLTGYLELSEQYVTENSNE